MNKLLLVAIVLVMAAPVHAQLFRIGMIDQDPDPVRAGEVVEARFKLENLWEETKYDVTIEVVPEYPFSVYGESNTKELGRIDGTRLGSDAVYFDFKLRVDSEAVDGDHEITLLVHDGENTLSFENMFFVDVEKELIKLSPYVIDSDLVVPGKTGRFTIEIANSGGTDVEALELELLPSEDYKLLSTTNYLYLGNLESDDTESEDFDVYVEEGAEEVHIPIKLSYEVDDARYNEEFKLSLNLLSEKEAKQLGLIETSAVPYVLGIGAVVILGLVVWKRRAKKR